jgi:hypothetical protein
MGVEGGNDFFIWIRRNPLKSLESAKEIQGNPSFFPWFYLVPWNCLGGSRLEVVTAPFGIGSTELRVKPVSSEPTAP